MNLLRRDETESGVVDLQIASSRRQMQRRMDCALQALPISLLVGDDLFDVHRRRQFVDGKMMGIDDLNDSCHEPYFAVGGFRNARSIRARCIRAEPDTVRCIPNPGINPAVRVGNPRIQFASRNAHEAADRVTTTTHGHRPLWTSEFRCKVNHSSL